MSLMQFIAAVSKMEVIYSSKRELSLSLSLSVQSLNWIKKTKQEEKRLTSKAFNIIKTEVKGWRKARSEA